MDEHTLRVLEFFKVRDILRGYAASEPGQAEVDRVIPSSDPKWVERSLKETYELFGYLGAGREFPISGLKDITTPLRKAAVEGAILRPEEFIGIASVARTSRLIRSSLLKARETCPLLAERATVLGMFEQLEQEVARAIGEDGEVLDSASFELKRIRRGLSLARSRINRELERILQDPAYAKAVQEPVITMRGDRYVVPLKPNFKMYIQGIVHDHSATKSTVFVEPSSTVELNNKLAQLKVDERREVERVLYELTSRVRENLDALTASLFALAELDLIYAKATYAAETGGSMPALKKGGAVELHDARHPLLIKARGKASAVPLDIKLGGDYSTLVITGPNTGGKTVVLKTVGLLVLMAQAGMLIPASPDSAVSVFENVFSDIGDEQSVEQSLSTFSSHISQIVKILGGANRESLVMLDEMGAGTDPVEGSALGVAILEELHRRGCRVVVTTHHGALKVFAANTPGVMNASVEFDPETLMPTYRLLVGRPGRSNALLVAERLGMPKTVIAAAERAKGGHEVKLDGLIEKLERESAVARDDRTKAAQELVRAKEERARLQELLRQADEERREAVRRAKEKAASVITSLKLKMRELEELGRKAAPDRAEVKKKAAEVQALEAELKSDVASPALAEPVDLSKLAVGDNVRVHRYKKVGRVLSIKKEKGQVVVQVDAMRLTLSASDIEPAQAPGPKAAFKAPQVTLSRDEEEDSSAGVEINIIGLRVDEAMERVERFLDQSLLGGFSHVRIIHGRGTGALRSAVRELLEGHRGVKSHRHAAFEEGGDAVTVVELRD